MMFQAGDLVRIRRAFCGVEEEEYSWIGFLIESIVFDEPIDEEEWMVHWAHLLRPTAKFGYYLEVI